MREISQIKTLREENASLRGELAALRATEKRLLREQEGQLRAHAEREAAERELEAQRIRSICGDRLRFLAQVVSAMSHELNQPLAGARGLAEHLLLAMDRGWALTEETSRRRLRTIIEQTDRMADAIEHLRRFATEAGSSDLQPVAVSEVVRWSLDMVGSQLQARGLEVECELAAGLPPVCANPFSLEEAILALLFNARQALESGLHHGPMPPSPQLLVRTRAAAGEAQPRVRIEIVDQGIGIPEEVLPHVFEPFFTTWDSHRASGLGLTNARSIVEQFGGVLELTSAPGRGTTATISLPPVSGWPASSPPGTVLA